MHQKFGPAANLLCSRGTAANAPSSASSFVFPSATSTVIGSVSSYTLDVDVPLNFLSTENIDWEVVINGTVVDTFSVVSGQTSVRVTNTISPGLGSCTFRYAGAGQNALTLQ